MRVLGVIPARGGSKGVPRKNIVELAGKPLLGWTIDAAHQSRLMRTILTTDDEEIAQVGKQYGVDVPFLRPLGLATDSARAIPVLLHALAECEKTDGRYDALMMLQPTSPMRLAVDIDAAMTLLHGDPDADAVISVTPVGGHHPARMKYIEGDVLIDPPFCEAYENQPRAELRPMVIRNGAIYLVRRDVLVEQQSLKGQCCLGMVIPERRSINIDTPFDLELAAWLMSKPNWDKA